MSRKSAVWKFKSLKPPTGQRIASCMQLQISRGGATSKDYNTTHLIHHLRMQHRAELDDLFYGQLIKRKTENRKTNKQSQTKQLTLDQALKRSKQFDCENPRAKEITKR